MPKDLLYASFKDAPYTSQFVGSIHPELKEAQQVLNQTYDLSKESDSKLAAVARDMAQKAHPKDTQAAQALFEDYSTKLAERAKAGNYERMLHETTNDARQFNVNASKIVAEKQRVDEALKAIDEDKNKTAEEKAEYKKMTIANQNSLTYDKNQGIVGGEGFKQDTFADDPQIALLANEIYGKGIEHEGSAYGRARLYKDPNDPNAKPFILTEKGNKVFLDEKEAGRIVSNFIDSNPKVQSYVDTRTRALLYDKVGNNPNFNWRTFDERNPLYQAAKQSVVDRYITPVVEGSKEKFGFNRVMNQEQSLGQLSEAYLKKGNGESPEEPLNPQHGTGATEQFGQEAEKYEDFIKKVENKKGNTFENEKKQAYISKNVLQRYMPEKLSDPISGEMISRDEFIKRKLETDKRNTGKGSRFVNQYQTEIEKAFEKERYSGLVEKEFNQKKKVGDVSTEPTIEEILKAEPNEALKQVYSVAPKGTPAKDVYKTWESFNNKIRNVNTVNKPVLPAAREEMTTYILGSPVKGGENQTVTSRNGGLFDNEPVRVFKNGKLVKGYKTGKEAIEDGAISREALSKLNVTHRNLGFTAPDMSAPYVATGTVDEDDYEVQVQPTQEIQKYEKVLKVVEPLLTKGMKYKTAPIEIDGKIATLRVNPFTNTSFDFRNHKVGNVDPVITVDMEGSSNDWTGPYSVFKNWVLTHNPYQNLLQNQNFEGDNTTNTKKAATDKSE